MASSTGIGRTTLREYIRRARAVGLGWPLPDDLTDGDLERLLFPRAAGDVRGSYLHKRQRITMLQIGIAANPSGIQRSLQKHFGDFLVSAGAAPS